MLRIAIAAGASTGLKMFVMCVYSAWAVKLGIIDADTNLLFALTMVLLSIYGLWVVVARASEYLVRFIEGSSEADAVPKG